MLDSRIARIGFQFWDGAQWVTSWDAANPPRLPQAVRVSYTLRGQPDSDVRVFDVPIPASDVDAQTPQASSGRGRAAKCGGLAPEKARRGYILVQALVVIAGLLALMAMLAADQRVSTPGGPGPAAPAPGGGCG